MAHGHCTECQARVTVRQGRCLLGHEIDLHTLSTTRGRHTTRSRKGSRGSTQARPDPAPPVASTAPSPRAGIADAVDSAGHGAVALLSRDETADPPRSEGVTIRHSELAPTGTLVVELWQTTGDSPPLEDWLPTVFDPDSRNLAHRVAKLLLIGMILGVLGFAGWLLAGWGSDRRQEGVSRVGTEALAVDQAADRVADAVTDLADGDLADMSLASTALSDLDAAARNLFDASSSLSPDTHGPLRAEALDAAQRALEIEATLGDSIAYWSTFRLIAEPPQLPSVVSEDDVAVVAADAAWWVSRFEDGTGMLPSHPLLDGHRIQVAGASARLPDWQASYLDAVRAGDTAGAIAVAEALDLQLESLDEAWKTTAGDVAEWGWQALGELREDLDGLTRAG